MSSRYSVANNNQSNHLEDRNIIITQELRSAHVGRRPWPDISSPLCQCWAKAPTYTFEQYRVMGLAKALQN